MTSCMYKNNIWHPSTYSCENGKYLPSIMDHSAIMCDEIVDAEAKLNDKETKTVPTNFNEKSAICKTKTIF